MNLTLKTVIHILAIHLGIVFGYLLSKSAINVAESEQLCLIGQLAA